MYGHRRRREVTRGGYAATVDAAMSMNRPPRSDEPEGLELEELAALADGSLAPDRRTALEARVAESPELADRLAEQRLAVALARHAAESVEAPASLRAQIHRDRETRRTRAPRGLVLIGAVATAAVAVAVGIAVIRSGSSAERFHAALGATDLAPGATGEATLTKTTSGWRINLHATGLTRLDGGRFYQAWLRNEAGVLVPIGTFNDGRKVTLWAGVSPRQFTTLTVTREQADGDQASSGKKVLVGKVDTGG
jgi:anti-sigma-K factor RskA